MSESNAKKLTEINVQEWIAYRWEEVTEIDDPIPVFLRGILRNPDEAVLAEKNFTTWLSAYRSIK